MSNRTIFFILFITLSACLDEPQLPVLSEDYAINDAIPLDFKEKISISNENLHLSFIKVIDESRCPENWKCLWEGEAEIELKIEKGELSKVIRLKYQGGMCTECSDSTAALGYKIKLENLLPYPEANFYDKKIMNFEDYNVVIRVTKVDEVVS
jgi:hypothetical protein